MPLPTLEALRQRKLVQWAVAYLGGAWLLLQVTAVLSAAYGWPGVLMRALPVVLVVGFFAALIVAWYHGEKGAQRVSGPELAILGALFLLGGLGVMLLGGGTEVTEADGAAPPVAGLPDSDAEQITLAVLPFESIGGDGVFADGLTDELLATLARVPSLRVSARTSASVFQNVALSSDSLGRALGVAHLVEGTVRESGDRLRVTARLVDAASGLQEWSETYNRDVADIFAVQEEIARAVAFQLRAQVGSAAMVGQTPSNPEVFELVVRARQVMERSTDETQWQAAMRLHEEAIVLDSMYAPAWSGLARARLGLSSFASGSDRTEERARATAEAEHALTLDPSEGQAHVVLGMVAGLSNLRTMRRHFEQAVAANPADADALSGLAVALQAEGDNAGALRISERVVALDPLSPRALLWAALRYSGAGRHQRAVELGRAMLALVPDQPYWKAQLANLLAGAGETEEAVALAERAVEEEPRIALHHGVLAYDYAKAGDRAAAERALEGHPESQNYVRAFIEAALGDRDAAFAALERSVEQDERHIGDILLDNAFLSLHDDPRWDPLVARIRATVGER